MVGETDYATGQRVVKLIGSVKRDQVEITGSAVPFQSGRKFINVF